MNITSFKKFVVFFVPFLILMGRASAQVSMLGVSPGDSFTYSFSVFWVSSNPNATVPASLVKQNETELIHVVITDVSSSTAFMNVTWQFKNGTKTTSQVYVNVQDGSGDGFGLVIMPDLDAKYYAYPKGLNQSKSFVINETLVKTYPFGEREVLHAAANKTNLPNYVYFFYDMYFDRKTGVMLEWYVEQVLSATPSEKISSLWKIKEFNVKSVANQSNQTSGQPWQGILVLIILVCVAAVIVVLVHKRKSRRRAHQH